MSKAFGRGVSLEKGRGERCMREGRDAEVKRRAIEEKMEGSGMVLGCVYWDLIAVFGKRHSFAEEYFIG